MPDRKSDLCLAVLIDADNAPRTAIKDVMAEVAVYGTPTLKRIYGDWTSPNMSTWKPLLLENAITPIQQYGYTTGKNSTDSAMIIDAMDILYSGRVDGFVLVSSDSDFTRLAIRLREAGMREKHRPPLLWPVTNSYILKSSGPPGNRSGPGRLRLPGRRHSRLPSRQRPSGQVRKKGRRPCCRRRLRLRLPFSLTKEFRLKWSISLRTHWIFWPTRTGIRLWGSWATCW